MTGYISLEIKLNVLNHIMILASADYSNILKILETFTIVTKKELV